MKICRYYSNVIKNSPQEGQILLIMVLTLVVALTVGLSVASRSLTNVKISKQNEESSRAFQAAEAGVEQVLQEYTGGQSTQANSELGNNAQFNSILTISEGTQFLVRGGNTVEQNIGADVQLNPGATYTVTVFFGTSDQNNCNSTDPATIPPAVEIIVFENPSNPRIQKKFVDPCTARTNSVGAEGALSGGSISDSNLNTSQTFAYSAAATPVQISNGFIMKIIPLYNSTKIGINSGAPLPDQGKIVTSTGTSGDTARTLQYFESLPEIPTELFQYAILSQ